MAFTVTFTDVCRFAFINVPLLFFTAFSLATDVFASTSSARLVASVNEGSPDLSPAVNVQSLARFAGVNSSRYQDIRIWSRNKRVDFFKVDQRGLLVASNIDLESMCFSNNLCCKNTPSATSASTANECGAADSASCCIELWLFPPENNMHEQVFVKVVDLNEGQPNFPHAHENVQVSENVRSPISLATPVDEDFSQRYIYVYWRVPDANIFSDKMPIRLETPSRLTLNLQKELDRETRDSYNFTVFACETERLILGRCGSMNVTLTVTDMNDNPPRFNASLRSSNFSVRETDSHETHVATLVAHDRDEEDHANINYDLDGEPKCALLGSAIGSACRFEGQRPAERTMFEMRGSELYAISPLDFEECRRYSLVVRALNNQPSTFSDSIEVFINVLDADDTRPCVKWVPHNSAKLLENSQSNQELSSLITVSDLDTPLNRITCEVQPSDHFRLKLQPTVGTVDFNRYSVVTTRAFNREADDKIKVEVRCSDRAHDQEFSEPAPLELEILDENDNVPEFETDESSSAAPNADGLIVVEIEENAPTGTPITKLRANDKDTSVNGEVEYLFANRTAYQMLSLDPLTGNLSSAIRFDYESKSEWRFVILATDRGTPRKTGTATLVLRVNDVNDNAPEFSKLKYQFRVAENARRNYPVGSVVARDNDSKPGITYRILETQDHFLISAEKGDIVVYNPLDRESMQSDRYTLTVLANDSVHSATTTVEIIVEDVNDCKPRFVNPTPENSTLRVSCPRANQCTGSLGCSVMHVRTVDDDANPANAQVVYSVKSVPPETFSINPNSGELFFRFDANRGCFPSARLTIEAQNPQDSTMSSTLIINVTFVKDDRSVSDGRVSSASSLPNFDGSQPSESAFADGGFISTHQLMIILVISAVFVVCAIGLLLVLLSRMHTRKVPTEDDAEGGVQQADCEDPADGSQKDDSQSQISSHDGDSVHKQQIDKMDASEYGGTASLCSELAVHERAPSQTARTGTDSPYCSKSQPLTPLKRGLIMPRRADRTIASVRSSRPSIKPGSAPSQPYVYYSVLNSAPNRSGGCDSPASHTTNSCFECSMQQHQMLAVKMLKPNPNSNVDDENAYASAAEYDPTCACPECVQVRVTQTQATQQQCTLPVRVTQPAFKFAAVHTIPTSNRYNLASTALPSTFNNSAPARSNNSSGTTILQSDVEKHLLIQRSDGYLTTLPRTKADGNNNAEEKSGTSTTKMSNATTNHTAACPPDCTNPRCLVSYV